MGWALYLVAIFCFIEGSQQAVNTGLIIFVIAMVCHWRWWVVAIPVAIISFLIGANYKKNK